MHYLATAEYLESTFIFFSSQSPDTAILVFLHNKIEPLYNTVRYNTVLYITRFKDGSQKCIDYIEK